MRTTLRSIFCAALAAAMLPIAAVAKPSANPLAGYVVPDAVTHHTMSLGGRTLSYTARAGTIVIRNAALKPQATMFYTAYTLDGASAQNRPVTFFYNGGPGSATLWLRMGSFGPVRVQVGNGAPTLGPPYHLVNNQYSLLDKSDLVFVDMAATGYGRILPGGDAKSIFGSDNDVKAFASFIKTYITRFGRWNSPKVLYGESYGTPRTAMLVNTLQNDGVGINGIVLQSSILDDALASSEVYGGAGTDDWQYIFDVPSEAAAAWFYHAVPGAPSSLPAYMAQVKAFAMGPYRDALQQGDQLSGSQYDNIVEQLHHYLGLSPDYIRNSNLRISGAHFLAEFRREQGQSLGFYDSRYRAFAIDRAQETPQLDATDDAITDAFISMHNAYVTGTLDYHTDLPYLPDAGDAVRAAGGWDFTHNQQLPLNTMGDLSQAMATNPHLQVFSANGYYDLVTPFLATVYELNHLGIPAALRANVTYGFYPSGHMLYLNPNALKVLHANLEKWYSDLR